MIPVFFFVPWSMQTWFGIIYYRKGTYDNGYHQKHIWLCGWSVKSCCERGAHWYHWMTSSEVLHVRKLFIMQAIFFTTAILKVGRTNWNIKFQLEITMNPTNRFTFYQGNKTAVLANTEWLQYGIILRASVFVIRQLNSLAHIHWQIKINKNNIPFSPLSLNFSSV